MVYYEHIDVPPTEVALFQGDNVYEQKLMVKVRKYFYGEHGVKYACPICDTISAIKPFSLSGDNNCPCCGVNLWWDIKDKTGD